jgi:hypothetical protein
MRPARGVPRRGERALGALSQEYYEEEPDGHLAGVTVLDSGCSSSRLPNEILLSHCSHSPREH